MKTEEAHISKEEWIIRLMQGMVGDYGIGRDISQCYYDHQGRFVHANKNGGAFYMDLNDLNPATDFWITNTKGVPHKELNIVNIKG